MKLPALLVIVVFSTSIPASGLVSKKIKHFEADKGGKINTGEGEWQEGDSEPVDFVGEFTPEMRRLQRQVLRRHNRYRRRHGVHALKRDPKLDRYAQAWALVMAKRDRMQHRSNSLYGENLYYWSSTDLESPITGSQAVKSWYDGIKLYDFDNPAFKQEASSFTQLVWKDTRRLGTGIARGPNGTVYIASYYDPQGNVLDQYRDQVPRPVSGRGGSSRSGHEKRRRRIDAEDEDDRGLIFAPVGHRIESIRRTVVKVGPKPRCIGEDTDSNMKLPAVLVIVFFSASVPVLGFIMKTIKFQQFGPGNGRIIQMGGGGAGAGSSEPVDFVGEFTPEMRKLQRQVLRSHNRYRRRHGVHTLKQDPQLDRYAQAWALVMAKRDRMQHRTNPLYGENLYMWWSSNLEAPITGSQAVKSWYDEIKLYNFDNPGFMSGTGHFTQLVWKDSRRLGTGIARGPKGTVYIVSVYDPRGNMMGQFGDQVPRPVSGGGEKRRRRKDEENEDD
ncbi:uncharacterized protein LOC142591329 [Dermacentor variabilis]|uniref:uncharacterized protein LOC142591329 n=1 Tax=Dermacentor variabilis TaxID=34621 RepID=UPI003F5C2D9E